MCIVTMTFDGCTASHRHATLTVFVFGEQAHRFASTVAGVDEQNDAASRSDVVVARKRTLLNEAIRAVRALAHLFVVVFTPSLC